MIGEHHRLASVAAGGAVASAAVLGLTGSAGPAADSGDAASAAFDCLDGRAVTGVRQFTPPMQGSRHRALCGLDAPNRCAVARLPTPADLGTGSVRAADPTGRFLVGYAHINGSPGLLRPLLWTDGAVTAIDAPYDIGASLAVNSAGVVAGSGTQRRADGRFEQVAWVYHDGRVTRLGDEEASYEVIDMNDRGDILAMQTSREINDQQSRTPLALVVLRDGH